MDFHKKTEITVETNEVLMVRRARVYRAWCAECGQEVDMVGMTDAEALVKSSVKKMRLGQGHDWHVAASGDTALVCMQSLLKSL